MLAIIKPMRSVLALLSFILFAVTSDVGPKRLMFIGPVLHALLIVTLLNSLRTFARSWSGFNKYSKAVFIFQVVIWLSVAIIHHPGFVNRDTFIMQLGFYNGHLSAWFTIAYSLIVKLFFDVDPSLFLFALFQVYIFSCCVYRCLKIAQPGSWLAVGAITLLTLHPLLQASSIYLTRDILFSLLTAYVILCFGEKYFNREKMDFEFIMHTVFITFLISSMRQEALLCVVAYPILIFFLGGGISIKNKLASCALLFIAAGMWNLSLYFLGMNQIQQVYQFTGIVHPLNYIVNSDPESVSPEQKAAISKIVDYASLEESFSPVWINQFHNHKYTLPVADQEWNDFLSAYRQLVLAHPRLFLRERVNCFLHTMNLTMAPFIFPDEFDDKSKEAETVRTAYGLKRWNIAPEVAQLHTRFLNLVYEPKTSNAFLNIFMLGSPLLLLLLSLVILVLCRNAAFTKFYIVTSAFCYVRIPALFLLAPEPQMKYYGVLIYYPIFMIMLGIVLFKDRKTKAD